jgi:hypothetical protein
MKKWTRISGHYYLYLKNICKEKMNYDLPELNFGQSKQPRSKGSIRINER